LDHDFDSFKQFLKTIIFPTTAAKLCSHHAAIRTFPVFFLDPIRRYITCSNLKLKEMKTKLICTE